MILLRVSIQFIIEWFVAYSHLPLDTSLIAHIVECFKPPASFYSTLLLRQFSFASLEKDSADYNLVLTMMKKLLLPQVHDSESGNEESIHAANVFVQTTRECLVQNGVLFREIILHVLTGLRNSLDALLTHADSSPLNQRIVLFLCTLGIHPFYTQITSIMNNDPATLLISSRVFCVLPEAINGVLFPVDVFIEWLLRMWSTGSESELVAKSLAGHLNDGILFSNEKHYSQTILKRLHAQIASQFVPTSPASSLATSITSSVVGINETVLLDAYTVLIALIPYASFLSRNEQDELVFTFSLGLHKWTGSVVCLNALIVCCLELPYSMTRLLPGNCFFCSDDRH